MASRKRLSVPSSSCTARAQGAHARSGVACADCHTPYMREGAMKISDHHVRSPLLNIQRACQTCHKWPEDELRYRVETIQERTFNLRNDALDAIVALVEDLKNAKGAGKTDADLAIARDLQRKAQFMADFIEAENSMGFHAPQEAARILAHAIDFARQGQLAVRDPNFKPKLPHFSPAGASPRPDIQPPPGAPPREGERAGTTQDAAPGQQATGGAQGR